METTDDLPSSIAERPSTTSPSDSLRHVQAAFRRHKPLGMFPSNVSRARRILVPPVDSVKNDAPISSGMVHGGENRVPLELRRDATSGQHKMKLEVIGHRKNASGAETETTHRREDSSFITPPSATGTLNSIHEENSATLPLQNEQGKVIYLDRKHELYSESKLPGGTKSIQNPPSGITNPVSLYQNIECSLVGRVKTLTLNNQEVQQGDCKQMETLDDSLKPKAVNLVEKVTNLMHENILADSHEKEIVPSMAQSSVAGSLCATTISVNSVSAPMPTSTTHNMHSNRDGGSKSEVFPLDEFDLNLQPLIQGSSVVSSSSFQPSNADAARQTAASFQVSASAPEASGVEDSNLLNRNSSRIEEYNIFVDEVPNHPKAVCFDEKSAKRKGVSDGASDMQSQAHQVKHPSSNVGMELPPPSCKTEKANSGRGTSSGARKKNYDPDVFIKVNGKLYQKLGKIGSGGSSEVFKVISADCTIYAIKKINLKGRDYSTAHGFCQEIQYLKMLKGMKNIIEMYDYEVTDKSLLADVMNGSFSTRDGRIKDDGHIYMVLEYGEIDLAHMLSQKWKEMDNSTQEIDENWLRFYWQQILQAVNTIHEERIVHSDLKPANFLLVKGSLKLIDFGIAKAILSDTTNIQRDAQVGTLNYMSPEAFMWNEKDSSGSMIKCGRPSDIWSLGCILYQMVYGRTPFAEYKTFWAKFKVITDQSHEIKYDTVSNPWLLDLMKKCLAWDCKQRWRIPQLLQHPFLVPPIPSHLPISRLQHCQMLVQMAEVYKDIPEAYRLCSQLRQLISDAEAVVAFTM